MSSYFEWRRAWPRVFLLLLNLNLNLNLLNSSRKNPSYRRGGLGSDCAKSSGLRSGRIIGLSRSRFGLAGGFLFDEFLVVGQVVQRRDCQRTGKPQHAAAVALFFGQ